jgi:ribosome biogenesis GTPase / thiamine phosphate phosphatase
LVDFNSSRLARWGWSERVEALLRSALDAGLRPGRIVSLERGGMRVATGDEEPMWLRPGGLAVGDWIALDGPRMAEVAPRWSVLDRLDPEGNRQVLAANVDVVLICAPADRVSLGRLERELVVGWDSGATPVVVVTKMDVAGPQTLEQLQGRLATAEVIATSALDGQGLQELRTRLGHPTTAALLGPSGAGKSTLVNALVGHQLLSVGAVRQSDHRGRHTTTARRLIPLGTGGSLIDMPGLRALASDASDGAVAAAFPDIDQLAGGCRFADCTHSVEPGCAVIAATANGELDTARLASYRKLERELAHERRQVDHLAQQAETRIWKSIQKAHRTNPKRGRR